jgi:biopolymer transport protein ExbD
MRFNRRHHSDRLLALEITPMIDVVFLLIIFFMTTARFAQVTRAELDLPREKGEQHEQAEEAGLVINLDATGALIVAQRTVTLEELEDLVREEVERSRGRDARGVKLMIRADRNLDTARLNEVVTHLQTLGVGAVRVATEVPR